MIRKPFTLLAMLALIAIVSVSMSSSSLAMGDNNFTPDDNAAHAELIAKNTSSGGGSSSGIGTCRSFLGLDSWDCNVDVESINNDEALSGAVWGIVVNVLKDLVVIAAYLILGYVIYGGYQYIFSGGEPGKVAAGKKTLTNGFIGLAIVLTANIIVSSIRFALGADFSQNCVSTECVSPTTMVSSAIQWTIAICGIVAAAFIVYGGILYITSSGDPQKTQRAKQTILYSIIGLAIVALAEVITAFVSNTINNSMGGVAPEPINKHIISKEIYEKNS